MRIRKEEGVKVLWGAGMSLLLMGCGGVVRWVCPVPAPCSQPERTEAKPPEQLIPSWKRWTVEQVLPSSDDQDKKKEEEQKKEKVMVPCQGKEDKDAVVLSLEGHKIRLCPAP